jgi:two-component system, NtrC family, response regulator GlrR
MPLDRFLVDLLDAVVDQRDGEIPESLVSRLRVTQAGAKLIGQATNFVKAIAQLPAIAQSEATVLISGETGTGKELVARAIHSSSARAPSPFVALNCGSLPESLMEDELFGHERGAFTDARDQRLGLIAQAERGTLFLDEVGTLTERAQVALLRVLQDKRFRALGSSREQQANVRFVAATNAPLSELVQHGRFRADLYYRLSVFSIALPPLRDRADDILPLARHFLHEYAAANKPAMEISPAAAEALLTSSWPGNVRELENAMIRAAHVCERSVVEAEDLGLAPSATNAKPLSNGHTFKALKRLAIEKFEREYLSRLMSEQHGNVTRAAVVAGKDRRDLGRLLKKYRIDPTDFSCHNASSHPGGEAPPSRVGTPPAS